MDNIQNIYYTNDSDTAGSRPTGSFSLVLSPTANTRLTLINTELDTTTVTSRLTFKSISLEGSSVLKANNIVVDDLSGNNSNIYLTDNSVLNARKSINCSFNLLPNGEIDHVCGIITNDTTAQENAVTYSSDLCNKTIKNSSGTYWYISKNEITFDLSNIIYVDQGNTAESRDGTMANPYNSLEEAYGSVTEGRNHIVIMTPYDLPGDFPNVALPEGVETVIISSNDGLNDYAQSALINLDRSTSSGSARIYTNTIFENIALQYHNKSASDILNFLATGEHFHDLSIQVLDNVKMTNGKIKLVIGSANDKFNKVNVHVRSGGWTAINISDKVTIGDASKLDSTTNICPDKAVNIHAEGLYKASFRIGTATIYGSTNIEVINITGEKESSFNGTYYGTFRYYEKDIANTYGDTITGTHYGYTEWVSEGTNTGYYGGILSGKYYDGFDIKLAAPANLARTSNNSFKIHDITVETEPMNLYIPEGTKHYKIVFLGEADKIIFNAPCNVRLYENISYMGWISENSLSLGIKEDRSKPIIKNLNLIIDGQERETPKAFNLKAFYGFDSVEVKGNADVNLYTDLDINKLSLGENAKINSYENCNVRDELTMAGSSHLLCDGVLTAKDIVSSVTAADNAPVLELKAPIGNVNSVTGKIEGNFKLSSNQYFTDVNNCEIISISDDSYRSSFSAANDKIYIETADPISNKVSFGSKIKYDTIYVNSGSGSDEKDGLTAETAVKTLEQAYTLVLNGGNIVICDNYALSAWPLNATKRVTISSYDGDTDFRKNGAMLTITCGLIELIEETKFGLIKLNPTVGINLCASGHKLTFGLSPEEMAALPEGTENLTVTNKNLTLHGGGYISGPNCDIIIHSGTYKKNYCY